MAARHSCIGRIYLGVASGSPGMDCETQALGPGRFLIITSQNVDCYECAAISVECVFHPYTTRFSGFLVRTSGINMSPELSEEAAGATFTCEFLSVTTCSLAKKDENASVVGAYCFVIHIGVEINSPDVAVTCVGPWCLSQLVTACGSTWYKACCTNKGGKIARRTLAISFGGKQDADITKAAPNVESNIKSDVIMIFIAGRLFITVSKGHLAREKSGLAVKHESTLSLKFCNMLKVESLDNSRMPHKQILKDDLVMPACLGGSSNGLKKTLTDIRPMQLTPAKKFVKSDCLDDKKMVFKVRRVKQSLISSKVDANCRIPGSLLHSTKAGIPLLRVRTSCWLWLSLLVILLSTSGVNPAEDDPSSKQGNCRYDLTSVAALSCVQPNRPWQAPSRVCCKALLYAIDHVPPSGESGACCLCRYIRGKHSSPKLVTAYVLCKGKDSRTVTEWSFPIPRCVTACNRSKSSPDMGASANKDRALVRGTSNGISKIGWLAAAAAAAAVILMGLICFWYFWRFKPAIKASEQRRRLLLGGDPRGGRRQSLARSSTQVKGRRVSTSRSSPNS